MKRTFEKVNGLLALLASIWLVLPAMATAAENDQSCCSAISNYEQVSQMSAEDPASRLRKSLAYKDVKLACGIDPKGSSGDKTEYTATATGCHSYASKSAGTCSNYNDCMADIARDMARY